jgi:adenine phosphoribosyltransferase
MDLKEYIRNIPDFPNPGVMFRDITTLLKEPAALHAAVDALCESLKGLEFDLILGPESRGFIFGVPLAYALGKGFVPVRKPGKLPCEVLHKKYELEYGHNTIEIHRDAIKPGQKVVIADDLLATGGTSLASAQLAEELGGIVAAFSFLIELEGLNGRAALKDYEVRSVVVY